MLNRRTRRVAHVLFLVVSLFALAGAGASGFRFEHAAMDMVLLQLTFYGAWACLVGAWVGGYVGAAMEEDACSELDMGVLSSMGAILGTLSAGLVGTALTGLGLLHSWWVVWIGTILLAGIHVLVSWIRPLEVVRLSHVDARGHVIGPDGQRLPDERQPPRMRDRLAILLALSVIVLLVLTFVMALLMGSDFGHPVMMAPMMYGMFGTMLGGMLGGWLAGLLDEHRGHPDHDNPVMVAAMALMAGMMGGMPSGMIGGMMAVMGDQAIAITVAAGLFLPLAWWVALVRGRYRFSLATGQQAPRPPLHTAPAFARTVLDTDGGATLHVSGMTCEACVMKVTRGVGAIPGVADVKVDLTSGTVSLHWAKGFPGLGAVKERVADLGYELEGL
jgi:copper chaperone